MANIEWRNRMIPQTPVRLLVFDPMTSFLGVPENDAEKFNAIMNNLRRMMRMYKVSVLFIHHLKKGQGEPTWDDIRGTSAILGVADATKILWNWSDEDKQVKKLKIKSQMRTKEDIDRFARLDIEDDDKDNAHKLIWAFTDERPRRSGGRPAAAPAADGTQTVNAGSVQKRGRGRPKGSKNKDTGDDDAAPPIDADTILVPGDD